MLNRIKVVTFILALVVGSFFSLDKAHAQYGALVGGHPVCDPDLEGCTGDFEGCNCEEECFFGAGVQDTASATVCAVGSFSYLGCLQNLTSLCQQKEGAEFGECIRDLKTGSNSCTDQLDDCLASKCP